MAFKTQFGMNNKRPVNPLIGLQAACWFMTVGFKAIKRIKYAVESAYPNNVTASELARSSFSSGNISN